MVLYLNINSQISGVWVRIFEHLKITNPDPNNKDVKSGALFETIEKVAKEISEVVNKKIFLQEIITSSKSKKELIKKLSREDPEYLIENLKNIEYVANIIYETPKNVSKKRKYTENSISSISDNKKSESENDDNEELLKKKTKKNPTPLFQEKSNFKNFELQDISIHLKITSYYNRVRGSTINIPVTKGNQVITSLLGPLKVKAKSITVHLENEIMIDCSSCQFEFDEVILCLDLNRLYVCILSEEDNQAHVFDKGNYVMVVILDYMDWMYQFKKILSNNDPNIIDPLGVAFNEKTGDSGISGFFSGRYIESAYLPDLRHAPTLNAIMQSV
ncbi:17470_t:CDS:2 [Dentiscutata erythropus]|uniref:17470_t:CDS:1 n=1 Tax=Dentiscutata erythropus TaxID=1348616 RepID=A0A9N9BBX1_9GLOM|nr:17470_t:CDS:2 [Dentiscutata erythropus]